MLTEAQTRSLLATAAATVEVGPAMPVPERPRRRPILPPAIAAIGVLLVAGGIVVARHGDASTPASPAYDYYPGDATFHIGPDQVPPVAGYPAAEARRLLEQRGYVVSEHSEPRCPSGVTVTAVSPEPGTIAAPGQRVDLTVATYAGHPCPGGPAAPDPFLAWAEGDGPAPRFAARVWIENDNARVTTLTGAARSDAAAWPGLRGLVAAATSVSAAPPDDSTPSYRLVRNAVGVTHSVCRGPYGPCAAPPTRGLEVHGAYTLLAQTVIVVGAHGAIRGVDFIDDRSTSGTFPDVIGDSADYATARLQAFGYAVTEVPRVDCAPVGMVTKVAFSARNVLIGVTRQTGACNPATP